jgi:general secretion pathway protein G
MHDESLKDTPEASEPSAARRGKLIVSFVMLLAVGAAFGLARLTMDPSLSQPQRQARADIRGLEGHFKNFHRVTGRFPTEAENFVPLLQTGLIKDVWLDPWGRPYIYKMEGRNGYVLSYGADGKPGGQGEDADIISGGVLERRP